MANNLRASLFITILERARICLIDLGKVLAGRPAFRQLGIVLCIGSGKEEVT